MTADEWAKFTRGEVPWVASRKRSLPQKCSTFFVVEMHNGAF